MVEPDPQVTTTPAVVQTLPQVVYAEQLFNANSLFDSVTLLSMNTDYTSGSPVVTAVVSSQTQTYTMHQTDWMVTGPNIEGVYPDTIFQTVFGPAAAGAFSVYAPVNATDPMTAVAMVHCTSSTNITVHLDWGDGTADDITVKLYSPITISHSYGTEGTYTIVATSAGAPTVKVLFRASLAAQDVARSPMTDGAITTSEATPQGLLTFSVNGDSADQADTADTVDGMTPVEVVNDLPGRQDPIANTRISEDPRVPLSFGPAFDQAGSMPTEDVPTDDSGGM